MKAKPIKVKNMWRIFVPEAGLYLGKQTDSPFMRYTEFENKFEALNFIEEHENLELDELNNQE